MTKAGFLLQIDAPDLAMERVLLFQDMSDMEYAKLVEQHVSALNKALEGIPADRVRLHVCWGNWEGPHVHDVAMEVSCRRSTRRMWARSGGGSVAAARVVRVSCRPAPGPWPRLPSSAAVSWPPPRAVSPAGLPAQLLDLI